MFLGVRGKRTAVRWVRRGGKCAGNGYGRVLMAKFYHSDPAPKNKILHEDLCKITEGTFGPDMDFVDT